MASDLTLQVYQAFQAHLDKNKFKYDAHDEDLVISLTVNGDDLPMIPVVLFDCQKGPEGIENSAFDAHSF